LKALTSPAMVHWARAPSTSNCLFFSGHQSCTNSDIGLYVVSLPRKNIQAYSFVTVYCTNFTIFLCVTRKLFSLSFVPLLARNPSDATVWKSKKISTPCTH